MNKSQKELLIEYLKAGNTINIYTTMEGFLMTAEDLKNIIKEFPEFEVIVCDLNPDKMYVSEARIVLKIIVKVTGQTIFCANSDYGYFTDFQSMKLKNKEKFTAVNECCMKIMRDIISAGLYNRQKQLS